MFTPQWIKCYENAFGSANQVFCGPTYSIVVCGLLTVPYLFGNGQLYPARIMNGLNAINVKDVICTPKSVICVSVDRQLLKFSPNNTNDIVYCDDWNVLPDLTFVLGLMKHMGEHSTPFFLKTEETFQNLSL